MSEAPHFYSAGWVWRFPQTDYQKPRLFLICLKTGADPVGGG